MTDNVRFKINAYLQILKYIDSAESRNDIIETICDLLLLIPDYGSYKTGKPSPTLETCCQKMNELFRHESEISARDAMNILRGCGFSVATIRRAKDAMKIKSKHDNVYGGDGVWIWMKEAES